MVRRIIFMGTPDFAVPSLETLIRSTYQVVAVYTQPDRQAGRGRAVTLSPIKQLALSQRLEVVQPDSLKASSAIDRLNSFTPDLIVVAAFGQILPPEVLALPKFGCLNVHPSLLPRYRGASPVATAILQGDEVIGVTIMLLDAGMDTGPILSQKEVPISAEDTTGSLTVKLAQTGAQLLMETLPLWIDGSIKPRPQDDRQASYSKVIAKSDGEMDWRRSTVELWRRVRAFDLWPGCYTLWQGKRLKIGEAVPLDRGKTGEPGKVVRLPQPGPAAVGIETADGVLGLIRVQLEGKREMSVEEFVRGHREFIGSHLL
ncbi:MAG: methionyl-tRNA formyltransferase [Chloroflexi bacterium RBG_13_50_10]|nr:MAG: methionyl-tRNA formyltransferase [Chloroflexi bacterium RBG_13_50_10]